MLSFTSTIDFEFTPLALKFNIQSLPINSTVSISTLNKGFSLFTKYSGLIPTTYLSSVNSALNLSLFNKLKSIEKSSPLEHFLLFSFHICLLLGYP